MQCIDVAHVTGTSDYFDSQFDSTVSFIYFPVPELIKCASATDDNIILSRSL